MKRTLALLIPAVTFVCGCATTPGSTAYDDGVRLYRDGYYASARDAFDAALHENPNMAAAWNNRGVARARVGDLEGAVQDYTQALRLAPRDAETLFNRGNAYALGGNLPAAIADFTAATALRPGYAEAFFNRGAVRAAAGDTAGAIADWQWAVDIDPDPWAKSAMRRAAGLDTVSVAPVTAVAVPPRGTQGGITVTTMPMPAAGTTAIQGPGTTAPAAGGMPGGGMVVTTTPVPGTGLAVTATPTPSGGTVITTTPTPQAARPPATPSAGDMSGASLDVRALVARAMGREVEGDRPGAVADLRAALTAETDPARRARIERLLRALETSR